MLAVFPLLEGEGGEFAATGISGFDGVGFLGSAIVYLPLPQYQNISISRWVGIETFLTSMPILSGA